MPRLPAPRVLRGSLVRRLHRLAESCGAGSIAPSVLADRLLGLASDLAGLPVAEPTGAGRGRLRWRDRDVATFEELHAALREARDALDWSQPRAARFCDLPASAFVAIANGDRWPSARERRMLRRLFVRAGAVPLDASAAADLVADGAPRGRPHARISDTRPPAADPCAMPADDPPTGPSYASCAGGAS